MSLITLRVVDGPERGKTFRELPTPITVGREEGNVVQLNDERISRYHMKIHENDKTILLTDLQSTNGTRVNGETVQLWILRPGDLISIGRSVILVGTAAEIGARLAKLRETDQSAVAPMGSQTDDFHILDSIFRSSQSFNHDDSSVSWESELYRGISADDIAALHMLYPPDVPTDLPPKQTAELAAFLQYIHLRLRYLIGTVEQDKQLGKDQNPLKVNLEGHQWQNLLDLYGRLSIYLRSVTEPKNDG